MAAGADADLSFGAGRNIAPMRRLLSHGQAALRPAVPPLRATIAALSANLVGIGLARFGYTPLIPALIAAGWFAPSAAVYLGAANLAGYLAGALGARAIAPDRRTALCCEADAADRGQPCRLRAAARLCLVLRLALFVRRHRRRADGAGGAERHAGYPATARRLAGGAIFTGVGLGIAASGTLVPVLMQWGLVETWLGLGATALVLTAIAWNGWPASISSRRLPVSPRSLHPAPRAARALCRIRAQRGRARAAHGVSGRFHRARSRTGGCAGGEYWVVFGAGALVGPMLGGYLGDRIGFRTALRLAFVVPGTLCGAAAGHGFGRRLAVSSFSSARSCPAPSRSRSAGPASLSPTPRPGRRRPGAGARPPLRWGRRSPAMASRSSSRRWSTPTRYSFCSPRRHSSWRWPSISRWASPGRIEQFADMCGPSILRGLVWIQRSCIDNSAMRSS